MVDVYDLSMHLNDQMPIFPTDPKYSAQKFLDHEKDGCNLLKLSLGTHTGTHVDVPLHHIPGTEDVSTFPLENFIGPAVVAGPDKEAGSLILPEDLAAADIRPGDILLVSTGWERFIYDENYFKEFPAFAPETADFLKERNVKAVGADIPSVDPIGSKAEFHHRTLESGIGIVEALINLRSLRGRRLFFAALPLNITSGDGSPVRAVAVADVSEL